MPYTEVKVKIIEKEAQEDVLSPLHRNTNGPHLDGSVCTASVNRKLLSTHLLQHWSRKRSRAKHIHPCVPGASACTL